MNASSCTPFDPLVDTERDFINSNEVTGFALHPLRSACGY